MPLLNPSYTILLEASSSPGSAPPISLHLRPYETTPRELSQLLTAQFGDGREPAVALALEDLVFPLVVVSARPDAVAKCSKPLTVVFATSPSVRLLQDLQKAGKLSDQEREVLDSMRGDAFVKAAFEVFNAEGARAAPRPHARWLLATTHPDARVLVQATWTTLWTRCSASW
jgi:hypothetical protein